MKLTTTWMMPAVSILLAGCPAPPGGGGNEAQDFTATLTGEQETPPVSTAGQGQGLFTLNAEQTELSFQITASGLSGPVNAAHFHSAPVGVPGDIVFQFTDAVMETSGQVTASGMWALTAADLADLLAGNLYVNLHTEQNPAGELRGQVEPETVEP